MTSFRYLGLDTRQGEAPYLHAITQLIKGTPMSIIIVTLLILIALALSYVLGYKTSHFGSNPQEIPLLVGLAVDLLLLCMIWSKAVC